MFKLHKFRYSSGYDTDTSEHGSYEQAVNYAKSLGMGSYRLSQGGKTIETFQVSPRYDGKLHVVYRIHWKS